MSVISRHVVNLKRRRHVLYTNDHIVNIARDAERQNLGLRR